MIFFKYLALLIFFLVLKFNWCSSANILIVLPTTLRSHLNVFNPIIDVLSTEHNVTFYSIHKLNKNNENITERHIANKLHSETNPADYFHEVTKLDQFKQFVLFMDSLHVAHFDHMLKGNDLNTLISSKEKYDLLITINIFSEPLFKLAHVFNVPLVQVVTSIPLPWNNLQMNNHNNLGYDLSFLTSEESYSYTGRLKKLVKHIYTWLYYEWVYLPPLEKLSQKYFPENTPTIKQIAQNTEALLVNYISVMGFARPNTPNVIEIGGLHCKPPKKLPTDLDDFLNGSGKHGVIYFSLGSTVSDIVLSKENKQSMLNVFKKLPHRILWKLNEEMSDLPKNVKISNWFPQQDILGHNKTKLFITQGGMLSLQEAVYHGVQVLVLPQIADQFTNGYLAKRKGYGKVITIENFNEDVFYNEIQDLIYNQKYRKKVKLISQVIKEQPISSAEKLKYWVNFIIRYKNSTLLRPIVDHLSLVEMMELDIFVTINILILIIVIVAAYIFYRLVKKLKLYYKINNKEKLT